MVKESTMKVNDIPIAFLFDLDGVLIDSESEYTQIWSEINRRFPTGIPDLALRIKGMTLDNILAQHYPEPEKDRAVRATLHELENQMTYRWLPGAKEFIQWLIDQDIPRVLVTSSDNEKMAHLKEEIPELEGMFTDIVTADKITKSKPDPEGYLLGAKLAGANPENCVVVEDSWQGVNAGKASGAFVIGVEGTLPAERIEPFCNIVVSNLQEIDKNNIIPILVNR